MRRDTINVPRRLTSPVARRIVWRKADARLNVSGPGMGNVTVPLIYSTFWAQQKINAPLINSLILPANLVLRFYLSFLEFLAFFTNGASTCRRRLWRLINLNLLHLGSIVSYKSVKSTLSYVSDYLSPNLGVTYRVDFFALIFAWRNWSGAMIVPIERRIGHASWLLRSSEPMLMPGPPPAKQQGYPVWGCLHQHLTILY